MEKEHHGPCCRPLWEEALAGVVLLPGVASWSRFPAPGWAGQHLCQMCWMQWGEGSPWAPHRPLLPQQPPSALACCPE